MIDLSKELLRIKEERDRLIRQRDMAKARYDVIWQQLSQAGISTEEQLDQEIARLKQEVAQQEKELEQLIEQAKELLGI